MMRKSISSLRPTGIFLYFMLALQSVYIFVSIGSLSGNEYPWKPSIGNDDWEPANRLFLMFVVIIDIITVFFNIYPFYQALKVLNEGQNKKVDDILVTRNSFTKLLKRFIFFLIFAGFFGAAGYICYLFQSTQISQERFLRNISYGVTGGAAFGPLFLTFAILRYMGKKFVNSKFKVNFTLVMFTCIIWTACRLYRGIHGIIDPNFLFNFIAEQDTSDLVWRGLIYFASTLLPYLFLVTPMFFPSFVLYNRKNGAYSHMLHNSSRDTNQDYTKPLN